MLNVKTWLETTGLKVAEESFFKAPALPYIVYMETRNVNGADDVNLKVQRTLTIELYSSEIDLINEEKIEDLLDGKAFSYQKDRSWIASDSFYQTVYEFVITERK